ncbi:PREDICTED: PXMP2/4 family protein 3-like [Tarenaya hassleriana]|uniref:PXMP2/4 family protein 3-like n=1 Tax=Tarenaya hassleriana TaxID=28532 RepID=UPI00053C3990|nr:PREDICTED: PXMP2/4 family protein 3-like [Tarenaya hassleriana]
MSGALLRSAASDAGRLFLRRNSPRNSFKRVDSITRDFGFLHSRAYFRSAQVLGKPKFVGVSGFCSSSMASTASIAKVGFVGWYLGMVKSRPVLTKSITSSLIYIAADLSSQAIARESYDVERTARMAGYGLLILGPTLHYWFNLMSRLFPKQDLITTFKKMALGQTIYGPSMTLIFFSLNAFLQGESTSEILSRLKRDLLPALLSGIMYWPMCDFITFKFFPVHLQPLVSNSFAYLWTVYLTYMASREKATAIAS